MTSILFPTICADPAWKFKGPGKIGATLEHRPNRDQTNLAGNAGSESRYGAMKLDDICALRPPVANDAHLYLWIPNELLISGAGDKVSRAWGFRPITLITWTKMKGDGTPSMKQGHYFRGATEHVVFAVRGSMRLQTRTAFPTAFLHKRLGHSVKPDSFYDRIEECSPGPYLEMFARKTRPGWISWGNQVPDCGFIIGQRGALEQRAASEAEVPR